MNMHKNKSENKEMKKASPQKIGNFITIGVFLAVVMGFFITTLVGKDKDFSENENRVLAGRPELRLDRVLDGTFAKEYEAYITDQFVNRDGFIGMKVNAERVLARTAPNGVYFAPDHYLIEEHKKSDIDETLVDTNIQRVKDFVEENADKMNIRFLLVPTASNVYPEWLPSNNVEFDQAAVIEKAINQIGASLCIDATVALKEHKEDYIFYRTDHHWTSLGAFYGYEAWAKSMGLTPYPLEQYDRQVVAKDFWGTTFSKVNIKQEADEIETFTLKNGPELTLSVKEDGSELTDSLYSMERLQKKDKYTVFLGGNNPYVEINTSVKNGKTLLVLQDSYAHCVAPFLVNHYEKIILLDYRYYNNSTKKLMDKKQVNDVLILYNVINFVTDKNIIKLNK